VIQRRSRELARMAGISARGCPEREFPKAFPRRPRGGQDSSLAHRRMRAEDRSISVRRASSMNAGTRRRCRWWVSPSEICATSLRQHRCGGSSSTPIVLATIQGAAFGIICSVDTPAGCRTTAYGITGDCMRYRAALQCKDRRLGRAASNTAHLNSTKRQPERVSRRPA